MQKSVGGVVQKVTGKKAKGNPGARIMIPGMHPLTRQIKFITLLPSPVPPGCYIFAEYCRDS